jgi:CBS domain-containing protein
MRDDIAIFFINQLRNARASALRDAEAYHDIVVALEQLGSFLIDGKMKGSGMGSYASIINDLAIRSVLARDIPSRYPAFHSAFSELYESVRAARNDAVHQGAYARHLTTYAIQLSLILEDALMTQLTRVADYMVRDPICAAPWQPISFVRQQMLLNSFSFLPVQLEIEGATGWYLIEDSAVARYLRAVENNTQRRERMAQTVEQAILSEHLKTEPAVLVQVDDNITDVLKKYCGQPLLVVDDRQRLAGIVTAFDLL